MSDGRFFFKPESQSIVKVFNGTNRYSIPDFQRPYSWKKEQIEALFDDIFTAYTRSDEYYFLGSIILTDSTDGTLEVIDGQQRLTSLTILFCLLRDIYFPNDNSIINRIQNLEDSSYRLSFRTIIENQNDFYEEIQKEGSLKSLLSGYDNNDDIDDYSNFREAALILQASISEIEDDENHKRLKGFLDYLLRNVEIITITCSDKKGAVRLFRILNDRGLDLSTSDLVKSYLYDMAKDDDERKIVIEEWKKIESEIKQTEDENPDEMLTCYSYFLLESYQKEAIFDRLEDKFDELLKKKKCTEIVYGIRSFAKDYRDIYFSEIKEVLPLWYLPNRLFWESILVTASKWSKEDFTQLSRIIRNTFYVYWLAGFTSAKLKKLTFDIIKKIKSTSKLQDVQDIVKKKIAEDDVFNLASKHLEEDADKKSWVKPLLLLLEYQKSDASKVEFVELDRKLHLEHVLPQEWSNNSDWKSKWSEADAKTLLHKIGNLTLLLGKKNIAGSNEAFDIKKEIYKGKRRNEGISSFVITRDIIDKQTWLREDVQVRGKSVVSQLKNILEIP